MFAKAGREQKRGSKRERARDGSRQAASLIFFFSLHIHTTGKNHQHQSAQGSKQTSSEARIGSTLLSVTLRLSYLGGWTPKGVEACPFLTPQPEHSSVHWYLCTYAGVWLL